MEAPSICYLKLWKCKSVIGGGPAAEGADLDRLVKSKCFLMILLKFENWFFGLLFSVCSEEIKKR